MKALQITLFGQVNVIHPTDSTPLKLSRSSQALLSYLLLQQRLVSRDVLMETFWIDHTPVRARSSLTTAIWRLRQLLEPAHVQPGTYLITNNVGEIGFNWDSSHWLDTKSFEQHITPLLRKPLTALEEYNIKQTEDALILYRGDLLEGIYDDWALHERDRFRSLYINCLICLMEFYASRSSFEQAIVYGHEILRRDPLREEVHAALMRVYLASGQRTLAIRQYELCRELLGQELGVAPLEETEALYQQIVTALPTCAPTGAQSLAQEINQLAHQLQLIKQSLDKTAQAVARMAEALSRQASSNENGSERFSKPKR
jgi:DNA-binding SARP family transcriptional activator